MPDEPQETPTARSLHAAQCRLVRDTQERFAANAENGGPDQRSQILAKTLLDLIIGQGKLANGMHPASKVER